MDQMSNFRIKKMNSSLINQISAGEVVESPAHAIKELIENSLDAGSTEIEVEIFDSKGLNFCVKDNGGGIFKDDLPLAIEAHATSKTSDVDDLWNVTSLGFRGEALASLASISCVQILSQHKNSSTCYGMDSNYGSAGQIYESSCDPGTQVYVKNLFENVPARLKFLKSDAVEIKKIKNQFKNLALAHPKTSFKFKHNSKMIFFYPQSSALQRVQTVLEIEDIYEGFYEDEFGHKVHSYFAAPNHTVKRSHQMLFFAQRRCVQYKPFFASVMGAFRDYLMHGEYPIVAAFVSCKPTSIDVNVHPCKNEVKFAQPEKVFLALTRSIRDELKKAPWLGSVVDQSKSSTESSFSDSSIFQTSQASAASQPLAGSNSKAAPFASPSSPSSPSESYNFQKTPTQSQPSQANSASDLLDLDLDLSEVNEEPHWSSLEVLGQARKTYILSQTSDSFLFIDQHAAHERVLFEKFVRQWRDKSFAIQNFLLPHEIQFNIEEFEALKKHKEGLESLGLDVSFADKQSLQILAAPDFLTQKALDAGLQQLAIDLLEDEGFFAMEQKIKDILATMACHSSIRAGQDLSLEEMQELLKQMDVFKSSFCPHGRPVFAKYSFYQIDKTLGRIT